MKYNIFYYAISIVIMAISCNSTTKKKDIEVEKGNVVLTSDTIKAMGFKDNSPHCVRIKNKYYKKFGVAISDYYVVIDSLSLDLNQDKKLDNILILSPRSLEDENNPCEGDTFPKRLLVEILKTKGGAKLRNIYSNLISDTGGVLSRYNGISKKGDNIEITHEAGAKYSWLYKVELTVGKNQLRVTKITKTCSVEGVGKTIELPLKNILPQKINIPDTLKKDCNCDKIWESLDVN